MNKQHLYFAAGFLVMAMVAVILMSCESGVDPSGAFESIIDMPSKPLPANFSTDQSSIIKLYWSDCDNGSGMVTYVLYIDTTDTPVVAASQLTDTFCVLSMLESNTTYYWRVEACTEDNCVKSPLWTFTTGDKWIYPLIVGQTWQYRHEVTYGNIDMADGSDIIWPYHFVDTITAVVVDDEIMLDGSPGYALQETSSNLDYFGYSYFQNRDDGLYFYGSVGTNSFASPWKPLAVTSAKPVSIGGAHLEPVVGDFSGNSEAGSILARPYLSLKYPFEVGSQWTVVRPEDSDAGWKIDKRILYEGQIPVYAGVFDCFVLKRYYDRDNDGNWDDDVIWYDYIGREGLLKRSVTFRNINIVGSEGDIIGTADMSEHLNLISYYRHAKTPD